MATKNTSSIFALRKFVHEEGTDGKGWKSSYAVTLTMPRSRAGTSMPGWKQKIANHQSATTPFTAKNAELLGYESGKITIQIKGATPYKRTVSGAISMPSTLWSPSTASYTDVDNRAKARFYKACDEAVSEFGGGEFFGEVHETVRMLKRPMSAIRDHMVKYLKHVQRLPVGHRGRKSFRKFNQAEKLRLIGATWLEYRFGFRPLIKDVNAALKEIGNVVDETQYIPVKAWEEREDKNYYSNQRSDPWCGSHIYVNHIERKVTKVKVKYTGEVKIEGAAPGIAGFLSSKAHLDLEHFVPTLWELAPMSWLVDYFANVGEVLQSIFFRAEKLAWYQRTVRRSCINEAYGIIDIPRMKETFGSFYGGATGSAGGCIIETSDVIRGVPELGWITPELKLPDFPIQFANMGSLVIQSRTLSEALNKLSNHK